jgi:hypothetical protein
MSKFILIALDGSAASFKAIEVVSKFFNEKDDNNDTS